MPEPIRVKDNKTGHEYSTYGTAVEGLTKLDEPAVDVHGELLPPTYPEAPAAKKPESTTGRTATTKES